MSSVCASSRPYCLSASQGRRHAPCSAASAAAAAAAASATALQTNCSRGSFWGDLIGPIRRAASIEQENGVRLRPGPHCRRPTALADRDLVYLES